MCKESCQINIVTRDTKKSPSLFFASEPGQVKIKKINKFNQQEIDNLIDGSDIIFNLIGILAESRNTKFNFVHCKIPEMIAHSAKKKVRNFIHISKHSM